MCDVSVWSLKLEIGFLPLFLRSFVALCCFLGYQVKIMRLIVALDCEVSVKVKHSCLSMSAV